PLSRFVTVTCVPTARNHAAQGTAIRVEPGGHRRNEARPVSLWAGGVPGTATVMDFAVSGVVGPLRKLGGSVVPVVSPALSVAAGASTSRPVASARAAPTAGR